MAIDTLRLLVHTLAFLVPYSFTLLRQTITTHLHALSYQPRPLLQLKNVIVIGGSFAGFHVAKRLTQTLPTGYRVILVEKNSHLNYLFAFPRFSVVSGFEEYGFIPVYEELGKGAPRGIYEWVKDRAVRIEEKVVVLESGKVLDYAYLVVATGTDSVAPNKVVSTERAGGMDELRGLQKQIAKAERIAIIGGGPVGVELASDIKDFWPTKSISLIHSRSQLLPAFGARLHTCVMDRMEELGVDVVLRERPQIPPSGVGPLVLGRSERVYDLIIPCIGQQPNSSILFPLSPASISEDTLQILVKPTLQLSDDTLPNIFSLGDVAATGGPRMARASFFQAEVIVENLLAMIRGTSAFRTYKPSLFVEGAIKLTLGKKRVALYAPLENGRDVLVTVDAGKTDMDVKRQWRFFGADPQLIGAPEAGQSQMKVASLDTDERYTSP